MLEREELMIERLVRKRCVCVCVWMHTCGSKCPSMCASMTVAMTHAHTYILAVSQFYEPNPTISSSDVTGENI